jgi:hypothetical protein
MLVANLSVILSIIRSRNGDLNVQFRSAARSPDPASSAAPAWPATASASTDTSGDVRATASASWCRATAVAASPVASASLPSAVSARAFVAETAKSSPCAAASA